jgi:hypothetical protein
MRISGHGVSLRARTTHPLTCILAAPRILECPSRPFGIITLAQYGPVPKAS